MLDQLKEAFNGLKSRIGFPNFNGYYPYRRDSERFKYSVLKNFFFGNFKKKAPVEEGFSSNTYVFSIIDRLAETMAIIPIKIYNRINSEEKEEVKEGDFYDFYFNPSPGKTYNDFKYEASVYQLATGNVMQYPIIPIGFKHAAERYNLAPQYFDIDSKQTKTGPIATLYRWQYGRTEYKFTPEEILHIKKFNPDPGSEDPIYGLSPLQAGYNTLRASGEVLNADASLLKNKGVIGMLVNKNKERPMSPEEKQWAEEALAKRIGGSDRANRVGVTSGDFDFIQMSMSSQDLQILQSGVMKLRDLASLYNVSSRMFNDPSGTTYNNAKEDLKQFYLNGVLPPLQKQIDAFNMFYVPGWNERDGADYIVEIDFNAIEVLQEDKNKEMVKTRNKSQIIRDTISGVSRGEWTVESAVQQLVELLKIDEDKARKLVDVNPDNNENNN